MLQRKFWVTLWVKIFVIFSLQVTPTICEPLKQSPDSNGDLLTIVMKNVEHLKRLDNKTDMIYSRLDDLISKVDQVVKQNQKEEEKIDELVKDTERTMKTTDENTKAVKNIAGRLQNITEDIDEVKDALTGVPAGKTYSFPANSCSSINKHRFNLKNGRYWVEKNGVPIYEYCSMDEAGIPLRNLGSCKEWKERIPESKSGLYNITIGEDSFPVYCEMDSDSGGWLMVGSAVVNSNKKAGEVVYSKIMNNDYRNLKDATTGRFLLSLPGLNALYDIQPFHEIRIDCWKKYHNRRVNIKIVGHDYVQFMLGRTEKRRPQACGQFQRLSNDTSFIGQNCHWDEAKDYLDWSVIFYDRPMYLWDGGNWRRVSIKWLGSLSCDDYGNQGPDNVGRWAYFIR